jgi:hypothetical protein
LSWYGGNPSHNMENKIKVGEKRFITKARNEEE